MFGSIRNSQASAKKQRKREEQSLGESFRPGNFIPGLVIGFVCGLLFDLFNASKNPPGRNSGSTGHAGSFVGKPRRLSDASSVGDPDEELKMVLVVRQDLKMGTGKVASQCAHAATGMYQELMQSHRSLVRQWECCGQPKIVVTCKNQQEMNKLKNSAESIGLPTFVVADAGRTQVASGSKTVLAIGPGRKTTLDSVTGKQRLL